jgi:hypothetical protein
MNTEVIDLCQVMNPENETTVLMVKIIKNMSYIITYVLYDRTAAGIPLMNATNFLLELTRTPTCHDFLQPGG